MKKLIFILGLVLSTGALFAQQDALYSQYMFNGLVLNPAYAGNKGILNVNLVNRNQWARQKIAGAPRTQAFTADGIFNDGKVGLGLHVINDELGAQKQFSTMLSYAYKISLSEETKLSFGVSAGVSNFSLDGTMLTYNQENDQAIPATLISNLTPDFSGGIYLSNDKYYLGLSTTHLLTLKHEDHFADYMNGNRHFFATAGYIWQMSSTLKVYPSTLLRTDLKGPMDLDFNASLIINDKIGLGGSYRTSAGREYKSNSAVAMMQLYLFDSKMRLGYSYDFDLADYGVPRNSHEISIGYLIPGKTIWKSHASPRYY
ncbi:type IX secretion system membrane protein PorP/SprF [Pedobacter sp. UC225_61]|uniref:type IX secretion system membrane protein PorP/SprF n=1 Tax=Pedobacter sp. UC225_61 TaxID=3374623 RepID=UPI0037B84985